VKVIFDNGYHIEIEPLDTPLSMQWYQEVQSVKNNLWERDRIYNLNDRWTLSYCTNQLRKLFDVLESYFNLNNFRVDSQEDLNRLHHYFENIIGIDALTHERKTDDFHRLPSHVQQAVIDFNILIHRLEGIRNGKMRRIVCTFNPRPRYPLKPACRHLFNFQQVPGTVTLNYCQVGKPPYDAFKDKDEYINVENIIPQRTWSADFSITFDYGAAFRDDFEVLQTQAIAWAKKHNITMEGWGKIDVGRVVNYDLNAMQDAYQISAVE